MHATTAAGGTRVGNAGHEVYFERHGSADATLLVLHGGPGISSRAASSTLQSREIL
jgi:hypothetical protein